jgi:hypothetical protein
LLPKTTIRLLTVVFLILAIVPETGQRVYLEAVRGAFVVLWQAADRTFSKRLKPILPGLISAMERHAHLTLANPRCQFI